MRPVVDMPVVESADVDRAAGPWFRPARLIVAGFWSRAEQYDAPRSKYSVPPIRA